MVDKGVSGGVETWKNTKRLAERDMIIFMHMNGDRKECRNYREISLFSLPRKVTKNALPKTYNHMK